jgi:hypothetical protein
MLLGAWTPQGVYLPHQEARNLDPDERGGYFMQYMMTWNERPQGSPIEYENRCCLLSHFEVRPVIPVADAIRVELEAMAYRDGLTSK